MYNLRHQVLWEFGQFQLLIKLCRINYPCYVLQKNLGSLLRKRKKHRLFSTLVHLLARIIKKTLQK